jgi:hypothetical protein
MISKLEVLARRLAVGTAVALILSGASIAAAQVCGDGIVEGGEDCDDGNVADGDGCDAGCLVEDGYICTEASFEIDFFEDWSAQGFAAGPSSWTLSQDGLTVTQTENSGPGVAMTNLPAVGVTIEFELEVQTTSDDDFIGWTVGYESGDHSNPSAEFMIFDWKQGDQDCGGWGYAGLAMNRVTGIPDQAGGCSGLGNFWSHANAVSEESRALTLGSTGWADNTTYTVELIYDVSHIQVWVDGTLEFDEYGTFPVGAFGFYTMSQELDRFTLVSPTGAASVCGLDPDQDPDGDGVPSGDDPAPWDPNICGDWDGDGWDDCSDTDGDGILDGDDNCPLVYNPGQEDLDGDGLGNECDADADGDGYEDGQDCDDLDAAIHPAATEVCDGVDNDCDGVVDGPDAVDASTWYADTDQDGFGDPNAPTLDCDQPAGYVADDTDCDDGDAGQYPGADEYCNGEDDDCDGEVDEDDAVDVAVWYEDADQDGFGNAAVSDIDCDPPAGFVADGTDCDDGDADQYPGADETCNGEDDDCDGEVDEDDAIDVLVWYEDADQDGFGNAAVSDIDCDQPAGFVADDDDCDDGDADQFPGADETCNGEDDDCDGAVDEDDALDVATWYEDADQDGFGNAAVSDIDCDQPPGYVADDTDCDDADADQYPGADETCNGEDDDCDGTVDEDDAVDVATWYEDADQDGFGNAAVSDIDCDQPPGYVADDTDCDDADANQYPGADEYCNGEDDDCDGAVDEDEAQDVQAWYEDTDHDGFGDAAQSILACYQPQGYVADDTDCDDADANQYPGADEYCNGEDDDCDGTVDEDDALDVLVWYEDFDGDGFGDAAVSDIDCDQPPGYVADSTDCDDTAPQVNPAAEEICNGIDDDCDTFTDELVDGDGDTFSICDGDCDDADAAVHPDAEEICDGIDNDCDPWTDEDVDGDGDGFTVCEDDCDDDEPTMFPNNPEVCDGLDNDCDGTVPADEIDDDGDAMAECEGDCDDADAWTYDGAPEQCDGLDNDCDGTVDEDVDVDLDGDGVNACQGDCDNNDPNVFPGAPEICDGKDSDCDGTLPADEEDLDGDGWIVCEGDCDDDDPDLNLDDLDGDLWTTCDGDCDDDDDSLNLDDLDGDLWTTCDGDCDDDDASLNLDDADGDLWTTCDGDCDDDDASLNLDDADGDLWTTCDGDCDDTDPGISPDADEVCDEVDNNCDGVADDVDADGDGYSVCDDDCDDGDPDVSPGADEVCDDQMDNDCDGLIDDVDDECEDEGDDDDADAEPDGDDGISAGGCDCRQDSRGGAPLGGLLVAALGALAVRRRR